MNAARLLPIFTELVILALGLLLAFLALSGRIAMPRGHAFSTIIGALLVILGLRSWVLRKQATRLSSRLLQWLRSVSLVVAGAVMFWVVWTPLGNPQIMWATVGAVLALRGFLATGLAALALRQ